MFIKKQHILFYVAVMIIFSIFSSTSSSGRSVFGETATTTVMITICGDGIVQSGEVCDDAVNSGEYATSTAGRNCSPTCSSFGPYCGDAIFQPLYAEECDDGNNTSGDSCAALCVVESPPTNDPGGGGSGTSGGGGAGGAVSGSIPIARNTSVIFEGEAHPGAQVHILKDGEEVAIITADTSGIFQYETVNITAGLSSFGFWSEGDNGARSVMLTTTFQVTQSAATVVNGIFIPPIISVDDTSVLHGDEATFSGYAAVNTHIYLHLFSDGEEVILETDSDDMGRWSLSVDTEPLANEALYAAKARYTRVNGDTVLESGFSRAISLYVGTKELGEVITADINGDGKVDLIDFSILLFHWGGDDIHADLNQDGIVDLTDFSILLFYWTG